MSTTPQRPGSRRTALSPFERPLAEDDRAEGNLMELPLWAPSNKMAKPKRRMLDLGTNRVTKVAVDADYTRQFSRITHPRGSTKAVAERVTIAAHPRYGFPGMLAYEAILAVVNKAARLNWSSQKVPITRTEMLRAMRKKPCGKYYALLDQAFLAASTIVLTVENAWLDPVRGEDGTYERRPDGKTKRRRHPGLRIVKLVKGASFGGEGYQVARSLPSSSDGAENELETFKSEGPDYVELGDDVWESAKSGYFIPMDLAYLSGLRTDTAKRLYAYLTKHDRNVHHYSVTLRQLAFHLALRRTAPSEVEKIVRPALEALKRPLHQDGVEKRLLEDFKFDGRGADRHVVVYFAKKYSEAELFRARLSSPVQEALPIGVPPDAVEGEWLRLKAWLSERLPSDAFALSLAGARPQVEGDVLHLVCSDERARSAISDRFAAHVERGLTELAIPLRFGGATLG